MIIVTFDLSFNSESNGCPGEKGQTFRNSKNLFRSHISSFLNVRPFTFLVALAHGVAHSKFDYVLLPANIHSVSFWNPFKVPVGK